MPKGIVPIYTQFASGTSNTITMQNIPQTFTDLKIVMSLRGNSATDVAQGAYIQFNGIGGSSYSGTTLRNNGGTINSYRSSGSNAVLELDIPNSLQATGTHGSVEVYIPNYRSNIFKQMFIDVVKEDGSNTTPTFNILRANVLRANVPIVSFQVGTNITAPNFTQHSSITLYGISR
jgi:hypothetical protein